MRWTLALVIGVSLSTSACELVADFDRSKIPTSKIDAGVPMLRDGGSADEDADVPVDAAADAAAEEDAGPSGN